MGIGQLNAPFPTVDHHAVAHRRCKARHKICQHMFELHRNLIG